MVSQKFPSTAALEIAWAAEHVSALVASVLACKRYSLAEIPTGDASIGEMSVLKLFERLTLNTRCT